MIGETKMKRILLIVLAILMIVCVVASCNKENKPISKTDEIVASFKTFGEVLNNYNGPVIYVSHSIEEVYKFCNSTAIMNNGRIFEKDTTENCDNDVSNNENENLTKKEEKTEHKGNPVFENTEILNVQVKISENKLIN